MRVLTVFSVIFLPLTLIASIWGMNIENMPLTGSPAGFWVMLGVMGVMLTAMVAYCKRKKWLNSTKMKQDGLVDKVLKHALAIKEDK